MRPIVVISVLYGLSVGAASYGISMLWGLAAQLIFIFVAFLGGVLLGRSLV